jgi:hypothetical protein
MTTHGGVHVWTTWVLKQLKPLRIEVNSLVYFFPFEDLNHPHNLT